MVNWRLSAITFICLLINSEVVAEPLPLKFFAKLPKYHEPQISPTGEYLAVIAPLEQQDTLVVIDLEGMQVQSVLRLGQAQDILEFSWVNGERLVAQFGRRYAGKGEVLYTAGELFGMDADGGRRDLIFGWRAGVEEQSDTRTRGAKPTRASGRIIDVLRDDRRHVLVAAYPFKATRLADIPPTIYKLNVYSGARKKLGPVPYGTVSYLADSSARIRVGWGFNKNYDLTTFYRDNETFELTPVGALNQPGARFYPLAFDESDNRIYVAASPNGLAYGVSRYDPATDALESIWVSDGFDVRDLVMNADETVVIGASYYADKLRYTYFDKKHERSRLIASIQHAFKDQDVEITSTTWDGRKAIIRTGNARTPDQYYLFDFDTKQMDLILGSRNWIDPETMSPAEHFEIESSDGVTLRGYLTRPLGEKRDMLPLVVMPHGGPHGIRDENRFNPDVQVLASRGFAVLQVNYRGSGGYGAAFQEAGYRNWGTVMQDDITDAVRWVISNGVADPMRICISGSSYGGYAALMSVIREPDLYQCAIGQFGVYDLPMMFKTGDSPDTILGREYMKAVIGTDDSELVRQSPSHNVAGITADLLIMYGEQDERAPPAQSIALTNALDEAEISYDLFVMKDAAHGTSNEQTREDRYRHILDFLDQHIGKELME